MNDQTPFPFCPIRDCRFRIQLSLIRGGIQQNRFHRPFLMARPGPHTILDGIDIGIHSPNRCVQDLELQGPARFPGFHDKDSVVHDLSVQVPTKGIHGRSFNLAGGGTVQTTIVFGESWYTNGFRRTIHGLCIRIVVLNIVQVVTAFGGRTHKGSQTTQLAAGLDGWF